MTEVVVGAWARVKVDNFDLASSAVSSARGIPVIPVPNQNSFWISGEDVDRFYEVVGRVGVSCEIFHEAPSPAVPAVPAAVESAAFDNVSSLSASEDVLRTERDVRLLSERSRKSGELSENERIASYLVGGVYSMCEDKYENLRKKITKLLGNKDKSVPSVRSVLTSSFEKVITAVGRQKIEQTFLSELNDVTDRTVEKCRSLSYPEDRVVAFRNEVGRVFQRRFPAGSTEPVTTTEIARFFSNYENLFMVTNVDSVSQRDALLKKAVEEIRKIRGFDFVRAVSFDGSDFCVVVGPVVVQDDVNPDTTFDLGDYQIRFRIGAKKSEGDSLVDLNLKIVQYPISRNRVGKTIHPHIMDGGNRICFGSATVLPSILSLLGSLEVADCVTLIYMFLRGYNSKSCYCHPRELVGDGE